jgi:hypothetical protein
MRLTMLLLLVVLVLVGAACGDSVLGPGVTTLPGPSDGATTTADNVTTTQAILPTTTESILPTTTQAPPTTGGGGVAEYDLAAGVTACLAGDNVACDLVYLLSPIGSDEEAIGLDCGGRGATEGVGCSGYDPATSTAYGYGDDPLLDGLWDLCAAGNRDVCDQLYFISPVGSSYETFGDTYGASS